MCPPCPLWVVSFHFFVLLAVSLAISTIVITTQPKGYGKYPKKNANNVVISNVTSTAENQSILIFVSSVLGMV